MDGENKKMTAREFKQILTSVGLDFDIYGYEGVLNELSLACRAYSFEQLAQGYKNTADWLMEINDGIYRALDNRGYFNQDEED